VLGSVAYRKIPAAAGVRQQFRRPRGKAGGGGGGNQVEYFPALFLDIEQGNAVNNAPVAALPPSLGVKDRPVQDNRSPVPVQGADLHNPGRAGFAACIIIIITPGFNHCIEITRKRRRLLAGFASLLGDYNIPIRQSAAPLLFLFLFGYTRPMRNKLTDELAVCGFNAVMATAEFHPEAVNRLFLREDRLKNFTRICKNLAERKRPYKICGDEELERICKSSHHQGVAAMIQAPVTEALSREDLEKWASEGKTGLVLHSVGNDHNLGAIVRSAAFFDAFYIVVSGEDLREGEGNPGQEFTGRGPPPDAWLTTSAYRIAEGGMEHVVVRRVQNTAAFLKDAARLLVTIGAESRSRQRIRDLPYIIETQTKALPPSLSGNRPGVALVLGNEEAGLPKAVKDACSCLVRIPGTGMMESLNVAQAAAVFLHEIFEL
jgi:TrmH RNA methyltransferase